MPGAVNSYVLGRVKPIWYSSPMRAAKVQASLCIRAISPEPPLLACTSSESRGTVRQETRSLAPLNGWTCAVKICHDGMLEDTNSLDGAQPCFNGRKSMFKDACLVKVLILEHFILFYSILFIYLFIYFACLYNSCTVLFNVKTASFCHYS